MGNSLGDVRSVIWNKKGVFDIRSRKLLHASLT